ncbi:hypothetical protein [Maritalea mediterranea]|nr:hypothetical protein [Maritalea mediterranea]
MSICCEEKRADNLPASIKELLCKAHAIGYSEEELAELRKLYGRTEEVQQ